MDEPAQLADPSPNRPPDAYAVPPVRPDSVAGPGRVYDWALIVAMLTEGHPIQEVARFTGCSRSQIWRILRRSNVARSMLQEVRIRRAVESATRLELAREASVDLILSQVREGNLRAALWVADRLGVTSWGYPTKKIAPQAADGAASAEAASAPDSAPDSVPDPDRSLYLDDEGNCVASPHGTEFDLKFDR
jgi:hypothetical protein